MVKHMQNKNKQVILIDACSSSEDDAIAETIELIRACDWECIDVWHQRIKQANHLSYLGSGKAMEFAQSLQQMHADMVIFQQTLSSLQANYLSEVFSIPVIDRSELIIEIFEQRAHTQEAKLQVSKAKLEKQHSRLIGKTQSLGRQRGGKNKGSGEKQLELNRRRLRQRIRECDLQIQELKKQHSLQYRHRRQNQTAVVALIGYTNAGKSSLLNALLQDTGQTAHKQVTAQDRLFATLDTALRRISLPYTPDILCVDTVGFVSRLPHELIEAFHATLDEIRHADLLLHIIDIHASQRQEQITATHNTLEALQAQAIPCIEVFNKCDLTDIAYPRYAHNALYISAATQQGIDLLKAQLAEALYGKKETITLFIPYEKSSVIAEAQRFLQITKQENHTSGMLFEGYMHHNLIHDYVNYVKF